MEELQDAIEDAQYVNAINTQDHGPKPVLPWEVPSSEEALEAWSKTKKWDIDSFLEQSAICVFLFSSFIKQHHDDYLRINFCEDVLRFKQMRGQRTRRKQAQYIMEQYILVRKPQPQSQPPSSSSEPENGVESAAVFSNKTTATETTKTAASLVTETAQLPLRTEIDECDLERIVSNRKSTNAYLKEEASFLIYCDYPTCSQALIGIRDAVLEDLIDDWREWEEHDRKEGTSTARLGHAHRRTSGSSSTSAYTLDSNTSSLHKTRTMLQTTNTATSSRTLSSPQTRPVIPPAKSQSMPHVMASSTTATDKSRNEISTSALTQSGQSSVQSTGEAVTANIETTTKAADGAASVSTDGTLQTKNLASDLPISNTMAMYTPDSNKNSNGMSATSTTAAALPEETDSERPEGSFELEANERTGGPPTNAKKDSIEKTYGAPVEVANMVSIVTMNSTGDCGSVTSATSSSTRRKQSQPSSAERTVSGLSLEEFHEATNSMRLLKQRFVQTQNEAVYDSLFDKAETVVMESLRRDYWAAFIESQEFRRAKHFLWYQDRPVVPDDFYIMRVLGRGGFGLVHACKKGTSGKLYAMKVMNKRRIKMKKSETLAVNERMALQAVESSFVVNLKYSFHSKDDVYLILDLMTGGDLGFHLHQKGRFSRKEVLYYAARIMLGLQALHDQGYVYRDLKPENCLMADDGRVKITDLGLATKITPTLHGAAGTRGYWAPEMLRRDKRGKRMPYGHTVDWFSFGCCVTEFICGANPFRSEAALNFGLAKGKQTKEKAIDCATMEMEPDFPKEFFEPAARDLCMRLLEKDENRRLGTGGCEEIMAHPYFSSVNWESIISDRKQPPYVPPKDVNAATQSEIGNFVEDKTYQETVLTEQDESHYRKWEWTNPRAFATEVIEFLIYERETGEPLLPMQQNTGCCCVVL